MAAAPEKRFLMSIHSERPSCRPPWWDIKISREYTDRGTGPIEKRDAAEMGSFKSHWNFKNNGHFGVSRAFTVAGRQNVKVVAFYRAFPSEASPGNSSWLLRSKVSIPFFPLSALATSSLSGRTHVSLTTSRESGKCLPLQIFLIVEILTLWPWLSAKAIRRINVLLWKNEYNSRCDSDFKWAVLLRLSGKLMWLESENGALYMGCDIANVLH